MKNLFYYIVFFLLVLINSAVGQKKHSKNEKDEILKRLNYYHGKRNYDSSIYYVDELVRFDSEQKEKETFIGANFKKIEILHSYGQQAKAFRLTLSLKDKYCVSPSEMNCSSCDTVYRKLSNYMIVMKDYKKAIRYLDQLCATKSFTETPYRKADLYTLLKLNDSALYVTSQSIQTQLKRGNSHHITLAYNRHGLIAKKSENYDVAISAFKSALEAMDIKDNNSGLRHILLGNLGSCYLKKGEIDLAYPYLLLDAEGSLRFNQIGSYINAEMELANIDIIRKSYPKGINRLKNLLVNYNPGFIQMERILTLLANASKAIGKTKDYHNYTNRWNELSINVNRKKTIDREMIMQQMSANALEQTIKQMETERQLISQKMLVTEKEKEKRQLRNWILISGLSSLILIILFSFWRYKSIETKKIILKDAKLDVAQKEKEILELKIKEENRNVQALSLELNLKQDFSKILVNRLEEFDNVTSSDIKGLELFIQNELEIKSTRVQLQNEMGDLSGNFNNALNVKYPNLTELDVKLAALIVMNMSNKDIGISKNITSGSVKIAKNRLKKKLSLSKEEDLHEHLNQFL